MKLSRPYTLEEICQLINRQFDGSADHQITGLNEIHMVEPGDVVFVDHPKYYEKALNSAATTILINKKVERPEGKALIFSEDPFADYNKLSRHFMPGELSMLNRGEDVEIHPNAKVHPSVIMGNHIRIGKDTVIMPGVVLYDNITIGERVRIHANTVLGGDAFYYKKREAVYDKMHSCGSIIIEDDVEIGTSCTIDRGVSGSTVIGQGSKLDNQIHIGHDTVIGKNCLFAAQVGIAGCTVIEDGVTLWGQVGVKSDIVVGEGAIVGAQSGVSKSLDGGQVYTGSPAGPTREKYKELVLLKRIPEILDKLKELEKS